MSLVFGTWKVCMIIFSHIGLELSMTLLKTTVVRVSPFFECLEQTFSVKSFRQFLFLSFHIGKL